MSRRAWIGSWSGVAAAALLVACSGEAEPPRERAPEPVEPVTDELPPPPATPERPPEPRRGTAREFCTLALSDSIAPTVPPGRPEGTRVAVAAFREESSALVAMDGGGVVELSWQDPASATISHGMFVRELEEGSLFALEMTGPDTAVLVRTGACEREGRSAQCLYARGVWLDRDGSSTVVSQPAVVAMPGSPGTMRIASTDGRLLLARSHVGAGPALDTFFVEDATHTVRASSRALGDGLDLDRGPVEILALAATGGSFAALWRHGAQEADDSAVMLTTGLDEHAVAELQEALVVESMTIFAGAIVMIAAFEFREPSWLRMGFDGERIGEVRPLPAGEEVPIPFADRRVARMDGAPPRTVEIRDGAGHATAPTVSLPDGVRTADLARFDGGFLVATLQGEEVRLGTLRCRSTTPSPQTRSDEGLPAAPGDDNPGAAR